MDFKKIIQLFIILAATCPSFALLRSDLNGDCRVDMMDLAILMSEWMQDESEDCMSLGPNKVTNGTFDTGADTDWEFGDGWLWFDGPDHAHFSYAGTSGLLLQDGLGLDNNSRYMVQFTVSSWLHPGGDLPQVAFGGQLYTFEGDGIQTFYLPGGESEIYFVSRTGLGTIFNIDDVSVREILSYTDESDEETLLF